MSRIHEALKKAEQERAELPAQDLARTTVSSIAAEPNDMPPATPLADSFAGPNKVMGSMSPITQSAPVMSSSSDYIRFEALRERCAKYEWHPDPNVNVFANPALSEHGAEQFRTLRSRLYQARTNQALRTLLVTSSVPQEGKTFVTTNLAQAIVRQPDRRVLVIDADLRRPRIHTVFGTTAVPGLTDYLRGNADEFAVIQCSSDENLCLIPGGTEVDDPSELLSNERLPALLSKLAPVFDWIILDSPPCLPVADASMLANLADGVLLVVRAGATPSSIAAKARAELAQHNVVGVVLNSVEQSHLYGADYYYQRYGYSREAAGDERTKGAAN
jgi:protein-tyrosine kinase